MASLIRHPLGEYLAIASECGRSSFPPVNEEEVELWNFVRKRFSHVSAERFLSGPGLQLIYEGLCNIHYKIITVLPTPAEITQKGVTGEDWLCKQTIDIFCRMFGTVVSNLAVMLNSFGGVYIGGGIIPKFLDYFIHSEFRSRFEDKGRYRPFLVKMPIYVITHEFPAFLGASHAMDSYLTKGYVP
jgi:glucokinase